MILDSVLGEGRCTPKVDPLCLFESQTWGGAEIQGKNSNDSRCLLIELKLQMRQGALWPGGCCQQDLPWWLRLDWT